MVTKGIEERVEKSSYQLREYIQQLVDKYLLNAYSFEPRMLVETHSRTVTQLLLPISKLPQDQNLTQTLIRTYGEQYNLKFHSDSGAYNTSSLCILEKLDDKFYFYNKGPGEIYIPSDFVIAKIGITSSTTSDPHGDSRKTTSTLFIDGVVKDDGLFNRVYEFARGNIMTQKQQSL